ncbi:unnamed protein product [Ceutorhynchus assimilis]|uniref:Small ribosomal subunit protein uS7 domain-containing protein n=1 Tax=Ceutorhynchus assimilis TaxID=467358 RepID=A0A9N9MP37_9CUCU|nr:unnamed protein product [Ceutorhynchus assimilis]
MCATKVLFSRCFAVSKLNTPILSYIQQNSMSVYPNYYIEPIYRKETQQELVKTGEISKYSHIPTKATLNGQTCSDSYDPVIALFTNYVMRQGLKALAREQMDKCFENIKRLQLEKYHKCTTEEEKLKIELDPKKVFHEAINNSKPLLQLTGVKRGGVRYQVPMPITDRRSEFIAMNWLVDAGKEKDRKVRFAMQLARELVDASNNTGKVVKRKQDLHRQCEANKAFAHYRWS